MIARHTAALVIAIAALFVTAAPAFAEQILVDVTGNGNFQACGANCAVVDTNRGTMVMVRTPQGLTPCGDRCMVVNPRRTNNGYGSGSGYGYGSNSGYGYGSNSGYGYGGGSGYGYGSNSGYGGGSGYGGSGYGNAGAGLGAVVGNVTGDQRAAAIGTGVDILLGVMGAMNR